MIVLKIYLLCNYFFLYINKWWLTAKPKRKFNELSQCKLLRTEVKAIGYLKPNTNYSTQKNSYKNNEKDLLLDIYNLTLIYSNDALIRVLQMQLHLWNSCSDVIMVLRMELTNICNCTWSASSNFSLLRFKDTFKKPNSHTSLLKLSLFKIIRTVAFSLTQP